MCCGETVLREPPEYNQGTKRITRAERAARNRCSDL